MIIQQNKYIITSQMHEKIKHVYQTMTGNGEVNELAKKLYLPRWKISRHAIKNGWISKQKKAPDWSRKELKILEENAHHSLLIIYKRLKKYGFNRSETAILLKRKRMRYLQNLKGQSATSLAECFGVDRHKINKAIKDGKLKATRRATKRTIQQGDTYYIKDKDIRTYIINYLPEIDIRKVDKYWFIDILTGKLNL